MPSQRGYKRIRKLRTFGKLVRDGIPKKIRRGSEEPNVELLPTEERRRALLAKLLEEAHEVAESTNPDDVCSELADLLEVVRGLARNEGMEWADVERAADEKASRLGGFDGGTVLVEIEASTATDRRHRLSQGISTRDVKDGSAMTCPT